MTLSELGSKIILETDKAVRDQLIDELSAADAKHILKVVLTRASERQSPFE